MHRVLSFQMSRNIGESSEYVTKRLCFSFLFSIGFLCLLCGFLLGRFAVERSLETQAQKTRGELAGNGLRNTEYLQKLVLLELERAPFDYARTTNWQTLDEDIRRVSGLFSNLSFVHKVSNHASCVRATVRGSREPGLRPFILRIISDRYVILSVNEDGIAVALELARILDKIYSAHNWRPRRSLIFCVSLVSSDVCPQALPTFIWRKVVAYVSIHGRFMQANSHPAVSGSDIMRSVAVEAIKTIPDNWTYLEHEVFGPRLSLDIPQVIFSFELRDNMYKMNNGRPETYKNVDLDYVYIEFEQKFHTWIEGAHVVSKVEELLGLPLRTLRDIRVGHAEVRFKVVQNDKNYNETDVVNNIDNIRAKLKDALGIEVIRAGLSDKNDNSPAHSHHYQNSRLHDVTLTQMVSQTIWGLSESTVILWEPRYFNETINVILESIDGTKFQDVKEKLERTLRVLLAAVKDLNAEIDTTDNTQMLWMRIWNDLLLDLDKALLCPDEVDSHSRTDLATFRKLSRESTSESITLTYLDQMAKCYEDAIQVLQER